MRVVILGCGSIGQRHLANLQRLEDLDLLAYDPSPVARESVQSAYDVQVFDTLNIIWEYHPTIAIIASPSNLHTSLALEAARHNCHLFIEKPLAHTLDMLDVLSAEVETRQLTTMVACNMRFHPGPSTVKHLLDAGEIGQVIAARIQTGSYLPRWRPQQDYRLSYSASPEWGGAILDCIHEIDLALWYLGAASVVSAAYLPATSLGLRTDGLAEVLLRHASGALSSIHLNFIQQDYRRACQIIGSAGTIYWDFTGKQVEVYGEDGQCGQTYPQSPEWNVNQMYIDELAHFLDAVQSGTRTLNPLAGGRAALEIALAIRQKGNAL